MTSEPVSPNTDLKITRALASINAARWFDFSNVEASLAARGDPLALQEISYLKTPASSSPASRVKAVNKDAEQAPVALNFDELADSLSTDDQENKQTVGETKLVVNQDIPKTALNTPGGFARLREAARRRSANIVVEPEKPVEKPKPASVRQSGSRPVFMKRSSAASQDTSTKKATVAPILRAPRKNSFYDSVLRSPKRAPRSESVTRVPERVPRPGVDRRAPPPRSASLSRDVLPPNEWERSAANRIALRKPVTWRPPTRTASTGPDRPVTTASNSIRARRPASSSGRTPSRPASTASVRTDRTTPRPASTASTNTSRTTPRLASTASTISRPPSTASITSSRTTPGPASSASTHGRFTPRPGNLVSKTTPARTSHLKSVEPTRIPGHQASITSESSTTSIRPKLRPPTRNPSRGPAQPPPKSSNQPTIPVTPKFATSQRMRASHSASKDDSKHQEGAHGDHHHKRPTAAQLQATIDRLSQPKKR